MKKILLLFFALIFLLCGCKAKDIKGGGSDKYKKPIPDSFSTVISVKQGDFECAGTISRENADALTITYSSPESVSGMKNTVSSDGTVIDYLGVNYHNGYNILPESNVLNLINSVFTVMSEPQNYSAYAFGSSVICDGESDGVKFRLERDKKTMNIVSIQIADYSLSVTFSEFT